MTMETIDSKVLTLLAHDARISWADLGAAVGLSPPAAAERVRRLGQRGRLSRSPGRLDAPAPRGAPPPLLSVALYHVRLYGHVEAVARLRAAIPRYNASVGGSPTAYHETITQAFIAVVGRFLDEHDHGQPLADLAAVLTATHGKFHLDRH